MVSRLAVVAVSERPSSRFTRTVCAHRSACSPASTGSCHGGRRPQSQSQHAGPAAATQAAARARLGPTASSAQAGQGHDHGEEKPAREPEKQRQCPCCRAPIPTAHRSPRHTVGLVSAGVTAWAACLTPECRGVAKQVHACKRAGIPRGCGTTPLAASRSKGKPSGWRRGTASPRPRQHSGSPRARCRMDSRPAIAAAPPPTRHARQQLQRRQSGRQKNARQHLQRRRRQRR